MPRNGNKNLKKSKSYTVVRDGAKTKRPPEPVHKPTVNNSEGSTPPAEDSSEH